MDVDIIFLEWSIGYFSRWLFAHKRRVSRRWLQTGLREEGAIDRLPDIQQLL